MSLRRWAVVLLSAFLVGLLFAVAFSGDSLVSTRAWVSGALATIAATLLIDFFKAAQPEPARIAPVWMRRADPPQKEPRGPAAIRATLAGAVHYPRAHAKHLRPRLVAITRHYLPIRHGIDPDREPVRVAALLGGEAWLIDPAVTDRTPTHEELHRFLDVVLAEEQRTKAAQ